MLNATDDIDFPPVQEGYIRRFTDHTGRWYEDIPEAEYNRPPFDLKSELLHLLQEEIDAEMIRRRSMREFSCDFCKGVDEEIMERIRALYPEDKYMGEQCIPSVSSR
jgi:hypothetical protein